MKNLFLISIISSLIILTSCSKTNISSSTTITNPILPLKAGNTWIYQDSTYDTNNNLLETYGDTAIINNKTTTISGVVFYSITDSLGYFGTGGYLALDPSNILIYQLDSLNPTPYVFFEIAPSDNYLLSRNQITSNPTCIGEGDVYGFASTFNVDGYSCYKNIDLEKDCNGNIIAEDIFYVSPNVGLVRFEDYQPVSSSSNNLYMDFSQTLKSSQLK